MNLNGKSLLNSCKINSSSLINIIISYNNYTKKKIIDDNDLNKIQNEYISHYSKNDDLIDKEEIFCFLAFISFSLSL